MSETAPFVQPLEVISHTQILSNLDEASVERFNSRISICSICEKCVEADFRPGCSEQNIPLAAAAEKENCPIGKW